MKLPNEEVLKMYNSLKPINTKTLARDHDIIDNVHGLVASTGGVGVDEGLLLGEDPLDTLVLDVGLRPQVGEPLGYF